MIILDTNVLGALMRSVPDAAMVKWLDRQPAESVWITSITLFEARFISTAPRRPKRHRWQPRVKKVGDPWICVTPKLPALRWRATLHWRPETPGILTILRFLSLILGSRLDDLSGQLRIISLRKFNPAMSR